MDRLLAMESYVRTVKRGSFAAAAADLGLSPSMVGNHVRFLEERLGVLLLHRTTRRQSVTDVGRAYLEQCQRILLDIEDAERAADMTRVTPNGLLRVTTPMVLGMTVMPGVLAAYSARCPQVQVEFMVQDRRLDLLADEIDVAIRVGRLADSVLIARSLPSLRLVACASPAYLASAGTPLSPTDLRTHNCLDFSYAGEPKIWRFVGSDGDIAVPVYGSLRIDNGQVLRVAALEHLGIILQPEIAVAEELASGRLIRLLENYTAPVLPLHILHLPNRRPSPKLRAFVDVVVAKFKTLV